MSKKTSEAKVKKTSAPRKKATKRIWKTRAKLGAFLAPSLGGVSVFYAIPFLVVIFYALVDNPISKRFVFLDNFINVFQNQAFQLAAWNTLKFSLVAVPLAVIISLLMAFLLDERIPFASKFRSIYLSPMMVPVASIILVFQVLFNYNGVINVVVEWFGGNQIDWFKSDWAPLVVLLLFLWKNLGYNMILFLAALGTIPREAMEVALLESNSAWKMFWHIKIRYLSPTILFVTIMSLISSFKVFREVYLLTGDYPYDSLYTLQHFMNNTFRQLDYQKLSSAAIIMAVVMVVIIGGLYLAENYFGKDMEE